MEDRAPGPTHGRYTNYFEIRFTAGEFLFDLGEHYPETTKPSCHTRIVTTIESARVFAALLGEALHRHNQDFAETEDTA